MAVSSTPTRLQLSYCSTKNVPKPAFLRLRKIIPDTKNIFFQPVELIRLSFIFSTHLPWFPWSVHSSHCLLLPRQGIYFEPLRSNLRTSSLPRTRVVRAHDINSLLPLDDYFSLLYSMASTLYQDSEQHGQLSSSSTTATSPASPTAIIVYSCRYQENAGSIKWVKLYDGRPGTIHRAEVRASPRR